MLSLEAQIAQLAAEYGPFTPWQRNELRAALIDSSSYPAWFCELREAMELRKLRERAQAGEDVPGWEAADLLGITQGLLRVWAHRGKLRVTRYAASVVTGDFQPIAHYSLSDVLALADKRGGPLIYW